VRLVTTGFAVKIAGAEPPVGLPNTVPAPAFDALKVSAGEVVGEPPSEVVNRGEKFPLVKLVNPPPPLPLPQFTRT